MNAFILNNDSINTYNNYSYDAGGRLVKDIQEEIDTIIWTVSGKVKEIRRDLASDKKNLTFDYDAMGNRIAKHVYNNQTLMLEKSTYYILACPDVCFQGFHEKTVVKSTIGDAQGNQLSMYDHKVNDGAVVYYLAERNIYGSSRLGTLQDTVNMYIPAILPSYGVVGNRNYELSNHLGNVLTVINDIVYPLSNDSSTVSGYEVGITQVSDYSPFGVMLDGRMMENKMYSPASNDNNNQTTPIVTEIYKNEFDSPPATTNPYSGTPTTLDGNLSNTKWTSSTGNFTNYNGNTGKSIAISSASADTAYVSLTMDVASGYELDITSYSFYHKSSTTGYTNYKLVINGIEAGSGSIWVNSGSTLHNTGVVNVSNAIFGQTGTVTAVLKLYGGTHGYSGTFRMDDFVLNGYTQIAPTIAEIYKNKFDSPPATTNPYSGTPTLDANLSNTQWTSSTGNFTNYNGKTGKAIAIKSASADTAYISLSMDVASGYKLGVRSYSFYHKSSTTGYANYKLVINGIEAGSGSIWVNSGSTLHNTGVINVSNAIFGQTGTVTAVLKLYGGTHGSTGTFRMDDFVLNGYIEEEEEALSGSGYIVSNGYRYGFQGMERDDKVKGVGNSYTTEFRQYDPRVGRWLSLDPLMGMFPYMSPYVAYANNPIYYTGPYGLEPGNGDEGDDPKSKLKKGEDYDVDQGDLEEVTISPSPEQKENREIEKLINDVKKNTLSPPLLSDNTRVGNYFPIYYEKGNPIYADLHLKGDIRQIDYLDVPVSKNLNKEVMGVAKFEPKLVIHSTRKEPVQEFDPDTYIGYRLRRTPGVAVISPTEVGWRLDTLFYDKITDKIYQFPLERMDTVTGKKKIYKRSPRTWKK